MIHLLNRLFRRARDIGADEYEQLSILQRTNMSEVWLARRRGDKLITVTKIARVDKPQYAKANQEAIRNEARWLHKFRGDARIVQIYRTGETTLEGMPRFIAAEYLDGGTVEDLLDQKTMLGQINGLLLSVLALGRRPAEKGTPRNLLRYLGISERHLYKGAVPVEQALELILYIAEGLAHLHRKGVVHRDIKPDNIMFRRRPKHGHPISADNLVLIDLGIASEHNRVAGAAIARGWSEPQRVQAREMRKALVVKIGFDIYCLGKVLRYLLTREKPLFRSEADVKATIPHEMLRLRTKLNSDQRADLANALTKLIRDCLHEDIDARPSAPQIVVQIDHMLQNITPSHQLLRGPMWQGTSGDSQDSRVGKEMSAGSATSMPRRSIHQRGMGAAGAAGVAGAVTIIAISILMSFWLWQNGSNVLAEIATPVSKLLEQATSNNMLIEGIQADSLPAGSTSVDSTSVDDENSNTEAGVGNTSHDSVDASPKFKDATALKGTALTGIVATSIPLDESSNKSQPTSTAIPAEGQAAEGQAAGGHAEKVFAPDSSKQPASEQVAAQVTRKPDPTALPTSTPLPTAKPTPEPSPTRKNRPTNTPTPPGLNKDASLPIQQQKSNPQFGPIAGLSAVVAPTSNSCRRDALDTWDEHVELKWTLEPAGTVLPPGYALEVVIWPPGEDPLDPNQAYTIHGRGEIIAQEGNFILQRKPKTLVPAVIARNDEYIWGVVLVNSQSGLRYQRLTPDDCRFHPASRLFGSNQNNANGGGK